MNEGIPLTEQDVKILVSPQPPETGGQGDVWMVLINAQDPLDDPQGNLSQLYAARRQMGIDKYKRPLAFPPVETGAALSRDPFVDLIQELLDGLAYVTQVMHQIAAYPNAYPRLVWSLVQQIRMTLPTWIADLVGIWKARNP